MTAEVQPLLLPQESTFSDHRGLPSVLSCVMEQGMERAVLHRTADHITGLDCGPLRDVELGGGGPDGGPELAHEKRNIT